MGQHKLLLPWPEAAGGLADAQHSVSNAPDGVNRPWQVIDGVLQAWTCSRVAQVVVIVRADDEALLNACRRWPVLIVRTAQPPADMKASCCLGLQFIEQHFRPDLTDRCFIAPADLPSLKTGIIDRLLQTPFSPDSIAVPMFGDRLGHPILLPWGRTHEILTLQENQGIDCVVNRLPKTTIPFPANERIRDIDTPQDYRQALSAAERDSV